MKANTVSSYNPVTGEAVTTIACTDPPEVDRIVSVAAAAFTELAQRGRDFRAALLRSIAEHLERRRTELVEVGMLETGLPAQRLHGELTRTVFQARFFADVVTDGGYLEVAIDHAGETPMGPGPDLRRMLMPIGPVAVFGASNFPLAFSVPGGDTVSAIAAGCPVIVKAHSSHIGLSRLAFDALSEAVAAVDGPEGTIGIVYGTAAGAHLVAAPEIRAVGFTGSQSGGQALLDIISRRETPIPFFGELSSLNPLIVTPKLIADSDRAAGVAAGLVASVTGSGGQLCTKPGIAFVPNGLQGEQFIENLAQLVTALPAHPLLNRRIAEAYAEIGDRILAAPGTRLTASGSNAQGAGAFGAPRIITVESGRLTPAVTEECFGPTIVIARYDDVEDLAECFGLLPASLTATIHSDGGDLAFTEQLLPLLLPLAGRLVFDQYPTGVLVSWAQHHGGPWPATNTQHTSVGATAIRRFLRPVVWQNAPAEILPAELRDDSVLPRRVDGVLVVN